MEEILVGNGMLINLILVIVTWLYAYLQIHQSVNIKYVLVLYMKKIPFIKKVFQKIKALKTNRVHSLPQNSALELLSIFACCCFLKISLVQ